jgi:hypothetical protein
MSPLRVAATGAKLGARFRNALVACDAKLRNSSVFEKTVLQGVRYELCSRSEVEFVLDVLAVELRGSNGDVQQCPDLSVRVPEREQA